MGGHAVACGHAVTAEAADTILREGGSAVDAVVAAALAASVAEPVLAGLFGGGFLMVREQGGDVRLLDFFVQTPRVKRSPGEIDHRAVEVAFETATQTFHVGAGTIAVPGVGPGLAEAHARYGRMPFRDLAVPAQKAAREGVEITAYQAGLGRAVGAILSASASARSLFSDGDAPLAEGAILRNPDLADVLEVFAKEGPRLLTEGEVCALLLETSRDGGHLTAADLRSYTPEWRTPMRTRRGDAEICANPPPALGGALSLFSLNLLDPSPSPTDIARAFEATLSARTESDIDSAPGSGAEMLLHADTVARYRTMVARKSAALSGTTHISIIDSDGMGAAMTLSNGAGSGLVVPGTGTMPNNMLGEEDLVPSGANGWMPDQRLASMMSPMSITWSDGAMAMLGSGGSNRIRTALTQVLARLIDDKARLDQAIEAPRLHVEAGDPVAVDFEDLMGEGVHVSLRDAYAQVTPWPDRSMFFGGVHAVRRSASSAFDAAGDPRRAGVAITG